MQESGAYELDKNAVLTLSDCKRDALETVRAVGIIPVIENNDDAVRYSLRLNTVRARKNEVIEIIERIRKPAYDAYQAVLSFKKDIVGPLEAVEKEIAKQLSAYEVEREQAEKEERERYLREIEADHKRQTEAEAVMLEAEGDKAAAEAVRKAPVVIRPDEFDTLTKPDDGLYAVRYRDNWKAEVTDIRALMQAIIDGKAPLDLLQPNPTRLNQMARALKGAAMIPGVTVRNEPVPLS